MTLTIRQATSHDIPEIRKMMDLLARHHGEMASISETDLQRQVFDLGRGRMVVAAEEEGLVGYALLEGSPNLLTGGMGYVIKHLFVVEWRRRAGIGRALIAALRALCRAEGAEGLMIGTHRDNQGAARAYRDMGLEEVAFGPRFKVALG